MALAAAAEECVTGGSCALVVLRSDGIGDGDPFLPDWELLREYARVDIRVAEFCLRGHPRDTSLRSAHRYMELFINAERERHSGSIIELGRTENRHEIVLRRDPTRKVVHAYYANYDETLLHVRWQAYCTNIGREVRWPCAVDWEELHIPARSAKLLHSFFQGDPQPQMKWWRFKIGEKRGAKVGNVLLSPYDLLSASASVDWYPYEPEALGSHDFLWEGAPCIETRRLVFRNWRDHELPKYAALCNTLEAMTCLGGHRSAAEVAEESRHFRKLGRFGPTFWAVESKSDGQFLGFCGVQKINQEDCNSGSSWEIGWGFSSIAQGRGIAIEASQAVLRSAFLEWGISELLCRIHPQNHASRRLAERLGMRSDSSSVDDSHVKGGPPILYRLCNHEYWRLGFGSLP